MKILCPYCNAEYLLPEVFYPNDVFGKYKQILKDENGKIISYIGKPDLVEEYECDFCNNKFKSKVVNIEVKIFKDEFNEEYTSLIEKRNLFND